MLRIDFNATHKLFDAFSYPGGERQVRLTDEGVALAKGQKIVYVRAVLSSPQDIIDLALLRSALEASTVEKFILEIPYLPYARADRRFTEGDCEGLGTFAKLLFSMSWTEIHVLDPHNQKETGDWVPSVVIHPAEPYIRMAIEDICKRESLNAITVVLPDEGAALRYKIPNLLGSNVHNIAIRIVHCSKVRDPSTGELSGFKVPLVKGPWIIVDDLCDGGGTFLGIAKHLPCDTLSMPRALYVTHGIFSRGFSQLRQNFNHIYTTDSFWGGELYPELVTVFPIQFEHKEKI